MTMTQVVLLQRLLGRSAEPEASSGREIDPSNVSERTAERAHALLVAFGYGQVSRVDVFHTFESSLLNYCWHWPL